MIIEKLNMEQNIEVRMPNDILKMTCVLCNVNYNRVIELITSIDTQQKLVDNTFREIYVTDFKLE